MDAPHHDESSAAAAYGRAMRAYVEHGAGLEQALVAALAADPELMPAQLLLGFAKRLLSTAASSAEARACLTAARAITARRGAGARDRLWMEALACFCEGQPAQACAALESALARDPSCVVSAKVHHALSFMYGDTTSMLRVARHTRARIARSDRGYGHLLGYEAFALTELGSLREAEHAALSALAHTPHDAWAFHALLHVLLAEERHSEVLCVMRERYQRFTALGNFAAHLAWHEALSALALGAHQDALALYDREILPCLGLDYRDGLNAIALLFRLERAGVAGAERWQQLADWAEARLGRAQQALADLHGVLALLRAGREASAHAYVAAMTSSASAGGRDAAVQRALGVPLSEALILAHQGHVDEAQRRYLALAPRLLELGGSGAQRGLLALVFAG